jgi:hypothetical protein
MPRAPPRAVRSASRPPTCPGAFSSSADSDAAAEVDRCSAQREREDAAIELLLSALGTTPGISASRLCSVRCRQRGAELRHRAEQSAACRDAVDVRKRSGGSLASSTTLRPAYITTTRSATSATTPRSCVISTIAAPTSVLQVAHELEDLRLHSSRRARWSARPRSAASGRRPAPWRSSRAGACRPRAGAGTRVTRRSGFRDADQRQHLHGLLLRLLSSTEPWCSRERLADLAADVEHRVERSSSAPGRSSTCRCREWLAHLAFRQLSAGRVPWKPDGCRPTCPVVME